MSADWPSVSLGELLIERRERVGTPNASELPLLGVSNSQGLHRSVKERIADMSRYFHVRQDWFAYNPMRINVGSIGWAETEHQTGVISPDYVVFSCSQRIVPRLLYLYLRSRVGLDAINFQTAGSVRERLYFHSLGRIHFPLPPLEEQQRIVARVDAIVSRVDEARQFQEESETHLRQLLLSRFQNLTSQVPRQQMAEVAPLIRRKINVNIGASYPELGIRSFAKGTFHKPSLTGAEVDSKKLYEIHPGDLVFNNVFAWEGAVAVANPEDVGRVGSHRFITCRAIEGIATARFLFFYFQTEQGLNQLREASPGGAGRNRTLGLEALGRIEVPVPPYDEQLSFDALQAKAATLRALQAETATELDALLPSVLNRAFAGQL